MKKSELQEKISELVDELANANRCIESEQRTAVELRARIRQQYDEMLRLGDYGTALNIKLAAALAALTAPTPEIKPTPSRPGSPANITGYAIKREGT